MNRYVLFTVVLAVVVGIVVFATNRPEPTSQQRLAEAAEDAAGAIDEAVAVLGDVADDAREAASEELESTASELVESATSVAANFAEQVNASAQETKTGLLSLVEAWKATGIVTEAGIDFDQALTTIEESNLSANAKSQAEAILIALRDAPDMASKKLAELEAALSQ